MFFSKTINRIPSHSATDAILLSSLYLRQLKNQLVLHPHSPTLKAKMGTEKDHGQWGDLFNLKNVAIHVSLLPTGKVLYWGRRSTPGSQVGSTLNEDSTKVYILDPSTGESKPTASEPLDIDGRTVNLFCSGHCFQPDGTLLVVGGHILDGKGLDQACVYDPFNNTWTAKAPMNAGRWYPSAITLPDGNALCVSGSEAGSQMNLSPQTWHTNKWQPVKSPANDIFSLYPRLYHDPKGRIFMAGPLAQSRFLDLSVDHGIGAWSEDAISLQRAAGQREYAASATYDSGKIIYIGGGGGDQVPPTKMAEIIDLNDATPKWTRTADIGQGRRHHFATVLPDGTVLVTGGTQGLGFNDLSSGQPVHQPELWNPVTGQWTNMAKESNDRCYHGTALLLPDGKVLSAGGGEYSPGSNNIPNPAKDSLISAQLFSPPYLFKGDRPTIGNPPSEISYRQEFPITVGAKDVIEKVSWVRIGSVTHACNMNQSFTFLKFIQDGSKVTVNAPANGNLVPPGHYMLFVLNKAGVPAVAPIIRLKPDSELPTPKPAARRAAVEQHVEVTLKMRNEKVVSEQEQPAVVVGLTPACPYGLGPCWGGAFEALQHISDIEVVRPMPSQDDSIAFVYLRDDILPDIDLWRSELRKIDGGTYDMRGIEMTLSGVVTRKQVGTDEQLTLAGTSTRPDLVLAPFQAASKIEWDRVTKAPKPMSDEEAGAYARLSKTLAEHPSGLTLEATGRLQKHDANKFSLDVRNFVVVDVAATS